MEKEVFKICFVKFPNSNRSYVYLCGDIKVEIGDYVYVEEQDLPLEVCQVSQVTKEDSPYSIDNMKRVVKNTTIHEEIEQESKEEIDNNKLIETELTQKEYAQGINVVAKVEEEFSYIDYHTDSLIKIKDNTFESYLSLIKPSDFLKAPT